MSPQERDEELLQEYLEGDSELSRRYRHRADEQPDTRLDARILAEARRAVARKSPVVHSPFARHWMVPASLAAVLVLSVSAVLLVPDPALEPGREPGIERERAAEPLLAPAAANAPEPTEPAAVRLEQTPDVEEDSAVERASGTVIRLAPGVDQAVDKSSAESKSDPAKRKSVTSGAAQSLPASPAAGVAEQAAPPAASKDAREAGSERHLMPADTLQSDPAAWLRFIERLLNEANREAAKSNLRAFRARYPDLPLPAALEPLAVSLDAERP